MTNMIMFMILMVMMIMTILIMIKSIHPIDLIMIMVIFSTIISLLMSKWMSVSIFSLITFIIITGGLSILFLYFSCIYYSPLSNHNLILLMKFFILSLILIILFYKLFYNNIMILGINSLNLNFKFLHMYSFPIYKISVLMIILLLYFMINIIKMVSSPFKSMRKML